MLVVLGDAPRADHLHVVVHQAPGAGGIAHLDQRGELLVHVEHAPRDLRRQRAVLRAARRRAGAR